MRKLKPLNRVMEMSSAAMSVSLILLSMLCCLSASAIAQTEEEWREDIDILVQKIERYHPVPWARVSREQFMQEVEDAKTGLKEWNREKITIEIIKLVASLRDGHTGMLLGNQSNFNLWFPLRLEWFHDGIFITATDEKNSGLLGARVLNMGKLDAEQAYARVGTIITSDSDHGIARLATNFLSNAVILETMGIIESRERLPLEVLLQDGKKKRLSLESAEWRTFFGLSYSRTRVPTHNETKSAFDDRMDTLPLYLSGAVPSMIPYWFKYLPDDRMLYFQYNNVADWSEEPFGEFTKRLFAAYDEHISEIDKFVIDVRFNSGGNGYLLPPFIREFVLRHDSLTRGKLFIITGGHTFSAASNFIGQMLKSTSAITVGDIAAGPLNWCSDIITFGLPNSNLRVNISTMCWQEGHPTDTRGYYPPDYFIPATFADYVSGSDPVLEAIQSGEVVSLKDILFNEGVDEFTAEFQRREKVHGPAEVWFPYTSFDMTIYTILILTPAGKTDEALELSRLNTVLYPEKIRAWYFLGDMSANRGELNTAIECYEKLLSIEPNVPETNADYYSLLMLSALNEEGMDAVEALFKNLNKSNPNEVHEGLLNNLGYSMLRDNRIQDAVAVFELNVDLHPEYANGYDSLAEAYMEGGDNERAIKYYRKSLELDPGNNNAVEMLERLEKK
jgi:tetratricopeptide (TPR) repeat protein